MALRITWAAADRFDTGVAAVEGGFVSAGETTLTRWRVDGDGATSAGEVTAPAPLPGPLRSGREPDVVAWGPASLRGGTVSGTSDDLVAAALADLGSGALRWFRLEAGTLDPGGTRVALDLRGVEPKTIASRTPATPSVDARLAVVRVDSATVERVVDDRPPSCLAWAGDVLLAGGAGVIHALGAEPADDTSIDLGDRALAARSVAVGPDGRVAAGMASGRVLTFTGIGGQQLAEWDAHTEPVTALDWAGDRLASGAYDGTVRTWLDATESGAIDVDAPVEALAWLDAEHLVVKAGGQGGRLLLLAG